MSSIVHSTMNFATTRPMYDNEEEQNETGESTSDVAFMPMGLLDSRSDLVCLILFSQVGLLCSISISGHGRLYCMKTCTSHWLNQDLLHKKTILHIEICPFSVSLLPLKSESVFICNNFLKLLLL